MFNIEDCAGNSCAVNSIDRACTCIDSYEYSYHVTPYINYGDMCPDYGISAIDIIRNATSDTQKKWVELCNMLGVDRIIRNGPATIVIWSDGSKTIVKRSKGEKDDIYVAFCAALAKKLYGNNSKIKRMLNDKTVYETKKKGAK